MYRFRFHGKGKPKELSVCVGDCIDCDRDDLPPKAYCSLCTDTASYGTGMASYDTVSYSTDTVSYGSSGKKGLPVLCSVLPPASNVGVLCCNATRTVLVHTLCNHKDSLQYTTSGTLLIYFCRQCNQSCHQFVAKHTLMSLVIGLGYFVPWNSYNDQTCFLSWMLSLVSCWQLLLPM